MSDLWELPPNPIVELSDWLGAEYLVSEKAVYEDGKLENRAALAERSRKAELKRLKRPESWPASNRALRRSEGQYRSVFSGRKRRGLLKLKNAAYRAGLPVGNKEKESA